MIAVRMMQVPIHQVIDVIAVRHCRMSAVRAVDVIRVMALAVVRDASVRVGIRDLYDVLVVMILMGAVEVPVVQIPDMIAMLDGHVAAVRPMLMGVILVDFVGHDSNLWTSVML